MELEWTYHKLKDKKKLNMAQAQQAAPFNRQKPKKEKVHKEWHTAPTKYGMGDNYGTGIKQKVGRIREDSMSYSSMMPKKLKTPTKSLA